MIFYIFKQLFIRQLKQKLILTISILSIFSAEGKPREMRKGNAEMIVTDWTFALNVGLYRNRVNPNQGTFLDGLGGVLQFMLPFEYTVDYEKSFKEGKDCEDEFCGRIFSSRPIITVHFTQKGGFAFAFGAKFAFQTFRKIYFEYTPSIAWTEAATVKTITHFDSNDPNSKNEDGLNRGFNFHHYFALSKALGARITLSLGYSHISDGGLLGGKADHDLVCLGFRYSF